MHKSLLFQERMGAISSRQAAGSWPGFLCINQHFFHQSGEKAYEREPSGGDFPHRLTR